MERDEISPNRIKSLQWIASSFENVRIIGWHLIKYWTPFTDLILLGKIPHNCLCLHRGGLKYDFREKIHLMVIRCYWPISQSSPENPGWHWHLPSIQDPWFWHGLLLHLSTTKKMNNPSPEIDHETPNFWDACQCKLLTSNMISHAIWCKQETILFS